MSENALPIGVDDGHSETKIVLPNGKRVRIPSQGVSGKVNIIAINEEDGDDVVLYQTDDGIFSVGSVPHADPTNFNDYPMSALNRAIVTHALFKSGVKNKSNVSICTGLPLKRFFIKGKPNKKLILAKRENLLKNDVVSEKLGRVNVVDHRVFSEGVAAWVDHVVDRNDEGVLEVNQDLLEQRIAVIDFGGRTLDIAVVSNWKLDADRSGTFDIGMLSIRAKVLEEIYSDYEVELTEEQLADVLDTRKFKMYGKEVDATHYIESAEAEVVNAAKAQVMRLLGKAADIDEILFVGGTSCYLEPHLKGWFPHQSVADDAAFANARGFQKFMELTQ